MVPTSSDEQEGSGGETLRAHLQSRRMEMRQAMLNKLCKLDGSTTSSVSLRTGIPAEDVERLGGISEET
jgi:hypothetical protein